MTHSLQKNISTWTVKHEEYCLKNSIPRSTQLFWEWLIKKEKVNCEIEPDLKDFNDWVKKHRGKPFCSKTLKSALNTLIEKRVISLVKRYTWHLVKVITRPLEYLKVRKKVQKRDIFSNLDASKAAIARNEVLQQQRNRVIRNKLLFSKYGIKFDDTELEVLDRPRREILLSVVCYQISDKRETYQAGKKLIVRGHIKNPEGWVRECLRRRYWDKPRTYQQILKEYGSTTFWFELFPEEIEYSVEEIEWSDLVNEVTSKE